MSVNAHQPPDGLAHAAQSSGGLRLGNRYRNDGSPLLRLNALQAAMKAQIDRKVGEGTYTFEAVPCCICNGAEFEELAQKDRYGLFMPVVICKQCGLIQTNPRMSQESYRQFYQTEYRKLYMGDAAPTREFFHHQVRRGRAILARLVASSCLPNRMSDLFVLEVGCGAGGILQCFREAGCATVGIDLDREYLEFGRREYGLNLVEGTLETIPIDPQPDVIIYSHVLEHILDPNAELQRVQRLLAPQGVVYVEVPGVKNLARACRMDFLSWLQNAHTTHFSLATLGNLMAKNGFAMHSGTEEACCIYRPRRGDAAPSAVVNDYAEAMDYLLAMEQWRRVIAPWYFPVRRRVIAAGIELLRLLGLHGAARRFYPTMQHEHPLPDDDA